MLYTDIPTHSEFCALDAVRGDFCVSIYLPTTPVTRATKADRILFKNLVNEAVEQLLSAKANKRSVSALQELLVNLHDDDAFWAYLADGLAVFATPKELKTFRLPLAPRAEAQISDRFHIKPLVPLLAAVDSGYVLALSQGAIRLVEFTPSIAETIKVPGLPKTMSDAIKRQLPRDRAPARRLQGGEGMKVLMAQFARIVDRALRPIVAGKHAPLVLAAVDELASVYRAHNTYPHLVSRSIKGNPEQMSDSDLAKQARSMVARRTKKRVSDQLKLVNEGLNKDYSSMDLAQIAAAAVAGRVGTLLVDVDASVPGAVNTDTGKLTLARRSSAKSYDVLDELVGLTVRAGGDVLPVSSKMLGGEHQAAALFRFRA
jgi:Bacterial archaeo-eukaryotic release factor family 11